MNHRRQQNRPARLAVAAATVLAVAGASTHAQAQGQSGVTLSGIADAAARHVSNTGSGSVKSLVSGSNATSRIVIRGSEDLGGGLAAGFWLEHGLLLDVGGPASTTMFWDRRSTVSLSGRTWGELRAGRDFVPSYVGWSRYDPFSYVGVAGSNNLVSASPTGPIRSAFGTSPNTTVRSSNSIQWLLPSGPAGWGGLEGGLMVAAGEGGAAADGQHKVTGARLGWTSKTWGVSAARTSTSNNLTTTGGFKDVSIGASADFGVVRASLAWRRFEQGSAEQTNTMLGLWVPVGAGEIKASWVQAEFDGRVGTTVLGPGARQLGLGYVHALSRRSALYATISHIDNEGTRTYAVPGGGTLRAGGSSRGVELGLRHAF